jgi:hypothetical protein
VALEELLQIFLASSPELDREVFMQKIYYPLRTTQAGGDAIVSLVKRKLEGKFGLSHLIQISCAFCIQAQAADTRREGPLARSYLMDAYLYLGMAKTGATSSAQVERLRDEVARDTLSTHARQSAATNTDPWGKAKDEAMKLIRERASVGESWATPSEAARAIALEVDNFLTQHSSKRFQSSKQRNITIAKWLRKMPEAAELFVSKSRGGGKVNEC